MFSPIPLNLPSYPFKISKEGDRYFIFDEVRKKSLVLTPEEWVRQHWIQYLIQHKSYPKGLLKIEGGLTLNGLKKRSDLVLFNQLGEKILIAEFKSPTVKIGPAVFEQVTNYNAVHRIPLLMVSNGLTHYYWKVDWELKTYEFLPELPSFQAD